MKPSNRSTKLAPRGAAAFAALLLAGVPPSSATAAEPEFLRGDVNLDGKVSISDALMLRRFLFNGDRPPACFAASDVDDNDGLDLSDQILLLTGAFLGGSEPPPPFPAAGPDPTPGGLTCEESQVQPPQATTDVIRIGEIEASPGAQVEVPVYVSSGVPIEAFQLVVVYDPARFTPRTGGLGLAFTGTAWDEPGSDGFRSVRPFPDEGFFIAASIGSVTGVGADGDPNQEYPPIPAGTDVLLCKIRGTISGGAEPGDKVALTPWNGPGGEGVDPPYFIRNEITEKGDARYVSLVPRTLPGAVAIIDEITFFTRGDANHDRLVDVSDAVHVLGHLFLGGPAPDCPDAADADDNGNLEVTDAVVIVGQLFTSAGAIAPPYPQSGRDETPDALPDCPR